MLSQWSFVSNHALVLAALFENPSARQRDIAHEIDITQGAVQRILHDLVESGHISVDRIGRRNQYRLTPTATMRHPRLEVLPVADLLTVLTAQSTSSANESAAASADDERSSRNEHAA